MSAALRRMLSCCLTLACLAFAGGRAFAGTTGSLTGVVTDAKSKLPLAGVTVSASSASQSTATQTDASGRFTFISLAPDTYTVGLSKPGFESLSTAGITVQSDQSQTVTLALRPALREIARTSARSSLSVVKPGTTTDVYSLDSAATAAAAPLGGGGSLNNAYSAIASLPGVFVPPGQMGVNQSVFIRGGYYDQIGYEYDGVPVNRSFDNFPGHSASTLGQQELQVYTGGGGADASASGLAGFINQVVKSGTSPGSADISARVGTPTFYHDLSGEIGGATADRRITYYFGASGYNQDFRYFDNFNGAGQAASFPNTGPSNRTTNLSFYPAVYPTCAKDYSSPLDASGVTTPPWYDDPGCFGTMNPAYGNISLIEGRELVGNVHIAVPHHGDGGRDDIQLLYTNSAQFRQYYSGIQDAGLTAAQYENVLPRYNGLDGAARLPHWPDALTYPSGTDFLAPADVSPIAYLFPGSPRQRCANVDVAIPQACSLTDPSLLPYDYRDARWDTASIAKLQYQKNIGTNAYVRLFGYTFYSDTNRSGAARRGLASGFGVENYDYEVSSHTRGAELQFGDQLSDRHQLSGSVNYVTATTNRINNFNYANDGSTAVSNLTNGTRCFDPTSGAAAPCNDPITQGTFASPTGFDADGDPLGQPVSCAGNAKSASPIPAAACAAGASWRLTYTGNQGALNTVTPKFLAGALTDSWRPNGKLTINTGLRLERDEYDLANTDTPGKNFWYAAAQHEYCYNPVTLQPVFVPQPPQDASFQEPVVTFDCPVDSSSGKAVRTVHPDGLDGHLLLSNVYNPSLVQTYVLPKIGATYAMDPNTVLRVSAGRYAQQPQAYEVQYNSIEENLANQLIGFLPYGFTTPRHDAQPQYSYNYDFSIEHSFRGTDLSVKLTPYYRFATNQLYTESVYGQSPSLNTGVQRNSGIELQFTKGDFRKNGLSGTVSYTYLDSKERWANFAGTNRNPVDSFNDEIAQYNALTKAGGGSRCYGTSTTGDENLGVPVPNCVANANVSNIVLNPYYGSAAQPSFDRNAYYESGLDAPYLSPNVFSVVLNYRHDKFAITPAFSLNEGTTYGSPSDVIGIDPRTCAANQAAFPTAPNKLAADYTSCGSAATPSGNLYVPNPESGTFDGFGQYRQPWQFNLGLQLSYDIAPRVTFNVTAANLVNHCFGGSSTPWSRAYPPSASVCGYQSNLFYNNNFYNGKSANDVVANGVPLNPYFAHSFVPSYADNTSFGYAMPLNVYAQLQVRL